MLHKFLALFFLIALVVAGYLLCVRPYQLNWHATPAEIARPMPGDELDPDPDFLSTRAITIAGTPAEIWPWLLQMGYGRAGFYGYDILENIGSPHGIRSAERILPQFQQFRVGDVVPISAVAQMKFYAIEPERYLTWSGLDEQGGFTWALYPLDETHTRLVIRIRWSYHWTEPDVLALEIFTELADFLAIRKILHGIADRVEGRTESLAWQNAEFAVLVNAFLLFGAGLLLLLLRPLTMARWLVGLAAGTVWLLTWYSPLPLWASFFLLQLPLLAGMVFVFAGHRIWPRKSGSNRSQVVTGRGEDLRE